MGFDLEFKGLNSELNPICHLLALLGAHHIFHVSELRFKCRDKGKFEYDRHDSVAIFIAVISLPTSPPLYTFNFWITLVKHAILIQE